MITPFNEDGSVDYAALTHLVNDQIDNGAGFICALGTTGETPCLTPEECNEIKRTVVKTVDGRVPVLLGISDNCTARLVNTVKNTDLGGVDGILSAAPSYNKPVQEGIYRHFMALSQASPLPIVLYNIPGRTGVNISADTVLRLVNDTDNIVAVKEASGNITQIADILQAKPDRFDVLSGDDAITYEMLGLGAVGVISVIGNAYPRIFSSMIKSYLSGNESDALAIQPGGGKIAARLAGKDKECASFTFGSCLAGNTERASGGNERVAISTTNKQIRRIPWSPADLFYGICSLSFMCRM